MSIVHALIIKNKKISFHSAHYSKIIKIILGNAPKNPRIGIDAGYIIIDFDSKAIVSSQSAFSIKELGNREINGMILFNM